LSNLFKKADSVQRMLSHRLTSMFERPYGATCPALFHRVGANEAARASALPRSPNTT